MNDNFKGVVGFIAGAVVSGIGMWFYQDKRLSDRFLKELNDYKAALNGEKTDPEKVPKEAVKAAEDMKGDKSEESEEDKDEEDGLSSSNGITIKPGKRDIEKLDTHRTNYSKYSSLTRGYSSSETGKGKEGEKVKVNAYYISEDEFWADGPDDYHKYELVVLCEDKEIVMANGKEFEDPQVAFGWDLYEEIKRSNVPVFVRNDDLKEMYAIDIEQE